MAATPTYELKQPVEGEVGDKVVLKKEPAPEKVTELSLNNLQAELDSAKQQEADAKARQVEILAEIAKVKEIVAAK